MKGSREMSIAHNLVDPFHKAIPVLNDFPVKLKMEPFIDRIDNLWECELLAAATHLISATREVNDAFPDVTVKQDVPKSNLIP